MSEQAVAVGPAARSGPFRWVAVAVVVVVLVLGVAFATRFGNDPRAVHSPLIGRPAPAVRLSPLGGGDHFLLSDLRGRPLVVNFWASWCVPCRAEHRELAAAHSRYAHQGVRFLGVVYQDDPARARGFLDELGWTHEYATDPGSRAAIDFGVFGVPETFFVDRDGIVRGRVAGPVTQAAVASTLDRMLAAGP